ncbi:MAG: acetylxylan esterase [Gemmataceae bacterium]
MPDPTTLDTFIRAQAEALRADDRPPATLAEWQQRRVALSKAMRSAMGGAASPPCELKPERVRVLARTGYRIELLRLQTRPDVWATATAYVPEGVRGKVPAVLVVHGHWAGARRDPTVQARCLGLVKLGFFVLAVDAFSAGERHPTIARGTYHGGLLGATLWPTGQTLLGLQVYDNRRMVDYLLTRPEVDGGKLGVTGASGGGNQTMYAGALDERFAAVVPVCSVGTYQAYLRAACCVCEVLPGALRFTEEGDVLGLIAPRALLVVNATKDALQFSVGEAKKSLERAAAIYKLYGKESALRHLPMESGHDYNRTMREAMYGWMTRWLKGEGDGSPIAEPKHDVEKPEDLACYPDGKRPATFLFPPTFAAREAKRLLAWQDAYQLDHREAWEAQAVLMREKLTAALGGLPAAGKTDAKLTPGEDADGFKNRTLTVEPEAGLTLEATLRHKPRDRRMPLAVLLHLDGRQAAGAPGGGGVAGEGVGGVRARSCAAPVRRDRPATRSAAPRTTTAAEHAVWIGRPLLGQWVVDVRGVLRGLAGQPDLDPDRVALIGLNQAGVVATVAAALLGERLAAVVAVDSLASFVTPEPFAAGTRMGLLAPGILTAGDIAPGRGAARAPADRQRRVQSRRQEAGRPRPGRRLPLHPRHLRGAQGRPGGAGARGSIRAIWTI